MQDIAVIIPVGPGHGEPASHAAWSVEVATRVSGVGVDSIIIYDEDGKLGRSKARNMGMAQSPDAKWYFFLDADDTMASEALLNFRKQADAVFGTVTRNGSATKEDRPVRTWEDLVGGPTLLGTLSMGGFFCGTLAREIQFNELLDRGEDFDFYFAFLAKGSFKKLDEPLCYIGNNIPSATGPRGYEKLDWQAAIQPFWDFWKERGRVPIAREERHELARRLTDQTGSRS